MQKSPGLTQKAGQKRIMLLSAIAYGLAYTLRVNIAVVIPFITAARGFTFTQMGLVTSLYFTTYMFGQLISGYLGEKLPAKLMIICGLFISAACNLGVSLASSFTILALCWTINGLAQSMLWAPLIKTLSLWFPARQLSNVSFTMSVSIIIAYVISWGSSSVLANQLGWIWAFRLPALVVFAFVLVLVVFFQGQPANVKVQKRPKEEITDDLSMWQYISLIRLPALLLVALTQGIIREGINIWFPTIIDSTGHFKASSPVLVLVIVPLINFAGVIFIRRVNRYLANDSIRTILVIFSFVTAAAFLINLLQTSWFWPILFLMITLLALTYGLTPVFTSIIPFQYAQFKRVSMTTGLIDFFIYLGAAIASFSSGWITDRYSWDRLMLLWLFAALIGLATAFWRFHSAKDSQRHEQDIH